MEIKIGDKVVNAEVGDNGVPVIQATAERIEHEDGRIDVIIHVPCFNLIGKQN